MSNDNMPQTDCPRTSKLSTAISARRKMRGVMESKDLKDVFTLCYELEQLLTAATRVTNKPPAAESLIDCVDAVPPDLPRRCDSCGQLTYKPWGIP